MAALDRTCRSPKPSRSADLSQSAAKVAPRRRRGADWSNFGILGEGKRIFHVNPEIAHRILNLAMPEKDLDSS